MSNWNPLINLVTQLLKIFCVSGNKQNQNQQHSQQQGYPGGQQQHQQQHQQQQQQPQWGQQQQGYPPQQQPQQGGWTSNETSGSGNQQQYTAWRNEARREGDLAHKCFADSQAAYKSGDGGRAHDLSVQGKSHQAKQDELDDKASNWIFNDNNQKQPRGTIDLHGLYVKEAIEQTEKAIADGQRSGLDELRVITGKGIHSKNHQAKIKPAVEGLMRKYNLTAALDPHNAGVLVVDLQGRSNGNRSRDAGGIVDQMNKNDGDCVIM